MDMELAETIIEAIENEGEDAELRSNYSGRGMYRESTHGVITNCTMGKLGAIIISNAELFFNQNEESSLFVINNIRFDQMGRGYIYY